MLVPIIGSGGIVAIVIALVLSKQEPLPSQPDQTISWHEAISSERESEYVEHVRHVLEMMPNEFSSNDFLEALRRLSDTPDEPSTRKLNQQLLQTLRISGFVDRIGGPDDNPRYRKSDEGTKS